MKKNIYIYKTNQVGAHEQGGGGLPGAVQPPARPHGGRRARGGGRGGRGGRGGAAGARPPARVAELVRERGRFLMIDSREWLGK